MDKVPALFLHLLVQELPPLVRNVIYSLCVFAKSAPKDTDSARKSEKHQPKNCYLEGRKNDSQVTIPGSKQVIPSVQEGK